MGHGWMRMRKAIRKASRKDFRKAFSELLFEGGAQRVLGCEGLSGRTLTDGFAKGFPDDFAEGVAGAHSTVAQFSYYVSYTCKRPTGVRDLHV